MFLAEQMPEALPLPVQKLIAGGHMLVNSEQQRASYKLQPGDKISVTIPPAEPAHITAEQIPLDIVFEDDQIIVINKAKGMTVHPAPGSRAWDAGERDSGAQR